MNKISKDIYYIGYIDWDLRSFHGYSTPKGSSYNSYLILDEKKVLVDAVKDYGFDEMLKRIKQVIDPSEIDYIIANHAEMDHSGSIFKLLDIAPKAVVVTNKFGQKHMRLQMHREAKWRIVDDGDELEIGKRKLTFMTAPMVHWPDNMAVYSDFDKVLFSNDAFGQHIASSVRFFDQVEGVIEEAAKYYANIVFPYGNAVLKLLKKIETLEIDLILTAHGFSYRTKKDIAKILKLYSKWASYKADNNVVIVYDSMWHSTEIIANSFSLTLDRNRIDYSVFNLAKTHISDVVTKLLDAKFILVGSPIMNTQILPTVSAFLTYLKGLKPQKRYGLTFGSYGWGPAGYKFLEGSLEQAKINLLDKGKYYQFSPTNKWLDETGNDVVKLIKDKF